MATLTASAPDLTEFVLEVPEFEGDAPFTHAVVTCLEGRWAIRAWCHNEHNAVEVAQELEDRSIVGFEVAIVAVEGDVK